MSKTIGANVLHGIPQWVFDNVPQVKMLRDEGIIESVDLSFQINGCTRVSVCVIPIGKDIPATARQTHEFHEVRA